MLPVTRKPGNGRGSRMDVEGELSRPTTALLVFAVLVLVPMGSYVYLHRSLSDRYVRLEKHMMAEMKEVTRLKQEVAGLSRIKDNLALSTSALKTALKSFGRPLPAGLVYEDYEPQGAQKQTSGFPQLGTAVSTEDLAPESQGYIYVPPDRVVHDCSPDETAYVGNKPMVAKFFSKRKNPGLYVEIGAGDGVYGSQTHFLEKAMCWTGILVEPTMEFTRLSTERPRSVAVHGAVCPADGKPTEDFLDITLNGVWTGWSGFPSHFSHSHTTAIMDKTKGSGATDGGTWAKHQMDVNCFSLANLLKRHDIKHVDYLFMSVQGMELAILKATDLRKVTIDMLEVDVSANLEDLKAFLKESGFTHQTLHGIRTHAFARNAFISGAE